MNINEGVAFALICSIAMSMLVILALSLTTHTDSNYAIYFTFTRLIICHIQLLKQ